jgi:hypothetical protein
MDAAVSGPDDPAPVAARQIDPALKWPLQSPTEPATKTAAKTAQQRPRPPTMNARAMRD